MTFGRIPFELLLRETQSDAISKLVIPVWCQFREAAPQVEAAGLKMVPIEIERASLQCELELDLLATSAGLRCEWAYRPTLISVNFVSDLMLDYSRLVAAVSRRGPVKLRDLVGSDAWRSS